MEPSQLSNGSVIIAFVVEKMSVFQVFIKFVWDFKIWRRDCEKYDLLESDTMWFGKLYQTVRCHMPGDTTLIVKLIL
jgi:hypothetical protein